MYATSPSALLRTSRWLALLAAALLLGACSTDKPTEPQQNPQPPTPQPNVQWVVTVTASPNQLEAGSPTPSTIRITVRRSDNGQAPPNGVPATVTTTAGEFNAPGSGLQSGTINLVNGIGEVLLFAPQTEGAATVSATFDNGTGRTQVSFSGIAVFFLQSVSPSVASPDGGDLITIAGGGFKQPVRVLIGGVTAPVQSVTSSAIRVLSPAINLPAGQTSTVSVQVTNALGTEEEAVDTLVSAFTYARGNAPTQLQVFSVTPGSGPNEGGTRATIIGEGFQSPVQVLFGTGNAAVFNGVEATVQSVSANQIVVSTPAATGFGQDNRDQDVSVLVRNLSTGAAAVLQEGFRYGTEVIITSIAPSEGPASGGQRVTLFGQGFDEPVAVGLAGIGQQILSVTGTEIIVRTVAVEINDCQDVVGPSTVTNVETGAGFDSGPDYRYEVEAGPQIVSFSPTTSPQAGGIDITVTGRNFFEPLRLVLEGGGVNGVIPATVVSSSQITFELPGVANSELEEEDCDANFDGTIGQRYIPTAVDFTVAVQNLNTSCEDTQTVTVIYTPADQSCRNDTGPPPPPPEPPEADFSFVANGLTVTFDNESTGDITGFLWEFGDGDTSTSTNPSHTYDSAGTYTVRLTATGPGGQDTETRNVEVMDP